MLQPWRDISAVVGCKVSPRAGQGGAFRLVGGEMSTDVGFGVPQIFHAGVWRTFCNGDDNRFDSCEGSQYVGLKCFNDVRTPIPNACMHSVYHPASCSPCRVILAAILTGTLQFQDCLRCAVIRRNEFIASYLGFAPKRHVCWLPSLHSSCSSATHCMRMPSRA